MWSVGVISGVWSMAVSIGGGFTGKPHHEVSLFLLSVSFFAASFYFLFLFCEKEIFRSCHNSNEPMYFCGYKRLIFLRICIKAQNLILVKIKYCDQTIMSTIN